MPRSQHSSQPDAHVPSWYGALWWRLGPRRQRRLVASLVLTLVATTGGRMVRPLVQGYQTAAEVQRLEAEAARLAREQRELRSDLTFLRTAEGQPLLGKRMGLFQPQERRLGYDPQQLESLVAAADAAPAPRSWGGRVRAGLDGAAASARRAGRTMARWLFGLRVEPTAARWPPT